MCGIAGAVYAKTVSAAQAEALIFDMNMALGHRGPDASGGYFDHNNSGVLGHTRLSIIDLSSLGLQPMHSFCGRYSITFNGEVYNHKQIKAKLVEDGFVGHFKSTTDTEVVINAISFWGIEKTIQILTGMFAFCVLDANTGKVSLVRDRTGEKPLYWTRTAEGFFFASELKALLAVVHPKPVICERAIKLFLGYGYIPAPTTIYSDIHKLCPAQILTFSNGEVFTEIYWKPECPQPPLLCGEGSFSEEQLPYIISQQIQRSIEQQMDVDVPFGALLSGGLDSSTVVALMTRVSGKPVETFSIGFDDENADESIFARQVAECLDANHNELRVTSDDFFDELTSLPKIYDEPFSDPSQLPTVLLAKFARQKVKVALTGDGGDETFLGYERYRKVERLWRIKSKFPQLFNNMLSIVAGKLTSLSANLGDPFTQRTLIKLEKLKWLTTCRNLSEFYAIYTSFWMGDDISESINDYANRHLKNINCTDQTSFPDSNPNFKLANFDLSTYLPDCLMVKTDRASMSVGLELRSPFLDHHLIELYRQTHESILVNMSGKKVLKKILSDYLPINLIDRPKMGFAPPIGPWLRGPLREWSHQTLRSSVLIEAGFVNRVQVERKFKALNNGDLSQQYQIWNLLMFENWALDKNVIFA